MDDDLLVEALPPLMLFNNGTIGVIPAPTPAVPPSNNKIEPTLRVEFEGRMVKIVNGVPMSDKVKILVENVLDNVGEFTQLINAVLTVSLTVFADRLDAIGKYKTEIIIALDKIDYQKIDMEHVKSLDEKYRQAYLSSVNVNNSASMQEVDRLTAILTELRSKTEKLTTTITNIQSQRTEASSLGGNTSQNVENLSSSIYKWGTG